MLRLFNASQILSQREGTGKLSRADKIQQLKLQISKNLSAFPAINQTPSVYEKTFEETLEAIETLVHLTSPVIKTDFDIERHFQELVDCYQNGSKLDYCEYKKLEETMIREIMTHEKYANLLFKLFLKGHQGLWRTYISSKYFKNFFVENLEPGAKILNQESNENFVVLKIYYLITCDEFEKASQLFETPLISLSRNPFLEYFRMLIKLNKQLPVNLNDPIVAELKKLAYEGRYEVTEFLMKQFSLRLTDSDFENDRSQYASLLLQLQKRSFIQGERNEFMCQKIYKSYYPDSKVFHLPAWVNSLNLSSDINNWIVEPSFELEFEDPYKQSYKLTLCFTKTNADQTAFIATIRWLEKNSQRHMYEFSMDLSADKVKLDQIYPMLEILQLFMEKDPPTCIDEIKNIILDEIRSCQEFSKKSPEAFSFAQALDKILSRMGHSDYSTCIIHPPEQANDNASEPVQKRAKIV